MLYFFFFFYNIKKKGKEESAYLFERGWGLIVSHIKPPPSQCHNVLYKSSSLCCQL